MSKFEKNSTSEETKEGKPHRDYIANQKYLDYRVKTQEWKDFIEVRTSYHMRIPTHVTVTVRRLPSLENPLGHVQVSIPISLHQNNDDFIKELDITFSAVRKLKEYPEEDRSWYLGKTP